MTNDAVPDRTVLEGAIRDALADEPAAVAAYLFGSVARGTAGPLSDIDLGLLLADGTRADDPVCDRAADRLCRRLGTARIDVISLAAASMPLRYRVVRDGSLVWCREAGTLERFIVQSVLHYLDFKPIRDRAFRAQRYAILRPL